MAQVLVIRPDEKISFIKKAQALYDADKLDASYEAIQEYLGHHPNDAQALVLAATILKKANKTPIAYTLAKRATELRPEKAETWLALGHCAQHLWLLDEAQQSYQKCLKLTDNKSQKALYLSNIGSVFIDRGKFKESESYMRKSLELEDNPLTRHNLGLSLLGQQKWKEGWAYYSASVGTFNRRVWKYKPPPNEEPTWDGTKGQTVVVYGEQGIGDELSFASMIPDASKDAKIILDCDERLEPLLKRSFPNIAVYGTRWKKSGLKWAEEHQNMDASISIGELGKLYRNDDESFPGTPYIVPCPVRTAGWKGYFKTLKKPVIGIAWRGGTWLNGAVNRYLPLEKWEPIFNAIDAHWVNLEYKPVDLKDYPNIHTYPWATLTKDYDDTAALVAACDLVICIQTSVAHLAGAMGVPVWTMVPQNSMWRYGEAEHSIPWYKSMKIFKAHGDWAPVVQNIIKELKSAHF